MAYGRASDSGVRGWGFETYLCRVVSLSKTLYSPKVLVIPRRRLLRPDMTETLLNGPLNLNTNNLNNQEKEETHFPHYKSMGVFLDVQDQLTP